MKDRRERRRRRERSWKGFVGTGLETLEDRAVPAAFFVTSAAASGPGSLAQAIYDSNAAAPGPNLIFFNISAPGPIVISPTSPLPSIAVPVTIDATTQPGFAGDPIVGINGQAAGAGAPGFYATASNVTIRGFAVGGFNGTGIVLTGQSDAVVNDWIGLDLSGKPSPNGGDGIFVTGASNVIGGAPSSGGSVVPLRVRNNRVVVAANNAAGIEFNGPGAVNNTVAGSYIGIDPFGNSAPNGQDGIFIDNGAGNETIGGSGAGQGNVVSANQLNGIEIKGGPGGVGIIGNLIGVNPSQTSALGNIEAGIFVNGASNNSISGNVVAGSIANGGIAILGPNASNNLVSNNEIGTDSTGTKAFRNAQDGVFIDGGSGNTIGSVVSGGNLILSNGLHGIELTGNSTGNTIEADLIGIPAVGSTNAALGNQGDGVHIDGGSSNNRIRLNTIAYNGFAGVYVGSGTGDAILSNSIYANRRLGIDLAPFGVNPNVSGGSSTGPNNLQNYPVLQAASIDPQGGVTIVGTLNAAPNGSFTIQFFADAGDPTGFGQGRIFLGQTVVSTDSSGNASFSTRLSTPMPSGYFVTATATDAIGDTSEFSARVALGPDFIVVNTSASGPGSLSQAILNVNAIPGFHTITFAIPGSGPFVIEPTAAPPSIVRATTIDATTQPGYRPGAPNVILDGYSAGSGADGLTFAAPGISLVGLTVQHFAGSGVRVRAANAVLFSNRLLNNVVDGVFVDHAPNAVLAGSNTISGNANNGVEILSGPNSLLYGATVSGNGADGVFVQDSPGVRIGAPGGAGNLIFANRSVGVQIYDSTGSGAAMNDLVAGNYVGNPISAFGSAGEGNLQGGIFVNGAAGVLIGGTLAGAGNVVSGNGGSGVIVAGPSASFVTIEGNVIGLRPGGFGALGNASAGVFVNGSPAVVVGGIDPRARNVISGNGSAGVQIVGSGSAGDVVAGNLIGVDAGGETSVPNSLGGVVLNGASAVLIGAAVPGGGNVISGNGSVGVRIQGPQASGTLVQNNRIGLDAAGVKALPNGADGVFLNDAAANLIGGLSPGQGNVISGNGGSGIQILGAGAANNVVVGNLVGTDATGGKPIGNAGAGIFINGGSANLIGFVAPAGRNVVAANGASGIVLDAGATGNAIEGNYVGLDAAGEAALGNRLGGVFISNSPLNLIGGTVAGAGNVISGNLQTGVQIYNSPSVGNIVQGNIIGLDALGVRALGNSADGVLINNASGNAIGGPIAASGNAIAANGGYALQIFGAGASRNFVASNIIGRSFANAPLPNARGTILVNRAGSNTVSIASIRNAGASAGAISPLFGDRRPTRSFGRVRAAFLDSSLSRKNHKFL